MTLPSFYAISFAALCCIALATTSENCDTCPNHTYLAHYTELGCTAVFNNSDTCCPVRFNCSSQASRSPDVCHYAGAEYSVGSELPAGSTSPCLVHCRCLMDEISKSAYVSCVSVECPEDLGWSEPSEEGAECVRQYRDDLCCTTGQLCANDNVTLAEAAGATCEHGGQTYYAGQKFYPDEEPCMTCICKPGFNGQLVSPFCSVVKCNLELHYARQMRKGCVPIYYQDRCCPIEWRCPEELERKSSESPEFTEKYENTTDVVVNGTELVPATEAVNATEEETATEATEVPATDDDCVFGTRRFALGESLPADIAGDECVRCTCAVPPVPTCVKNYAFC